MAQILIIEDDPKTASAIGDGLRLDGYEAVAVTTGEEGARWNYRTGQRCRTGQYVPHSSVVRTLRAEFVGPLFTVFFDGKKLFEVEDDTFLNAGAVGVWTKADSITFFDDFSYGAK